MEINERLIFHNGHDTLEISARSPLFPQLVEGLDFMENSFLSTDNYNEDGLSVSGSKVRERNIVISGYILQDKNVYKDRLIRFFNPKQQLTLTYNNGTIERHIKCYIEKTPSVVNDGMYLFNLSLLCPKPWWYDKEVKVDIAAWVGSFSFPLEIEEQGIELGFREPSLIVNVNNTSDNQAPIRVDFRAIGTLTNPSIVNVETQEQIKIEMELQSGDVVTVNTERGNEYVRLNRGGVVSNVFNNLTIESNPQFTVDIGDNLIRYDAETNIENLEVSLYFLPQFVGV